MTTSLFQNSYYIGTAFNGILYGVELVLYLQTMRALLRKNTKHPRIDRFFTMFSTALFLLVTIFVATRAVFGEQMWIVNTNFTGGPGAYLTTYFAVWYQTMGATAAILLQLIGNGILIYRCFIIYENYVVLIFPCVLWVATLVVGILDLYYYGRPSGGIFIGTTDHLGVAYASTSVGLNVIVSAMICIRVAYTGVGTSAPRPLAMDKEIIKYAGTVPIIVESALPYAMSGIAFVISYGIRSSTSVLFLSIYVMFSCISAQIIIMRVAHGNAWKPYGTSTSATRLQRTTQSRSAPTAERDGKVYSEMHPSGSFYPEMVV